MLDASGRTYRLLQESTVGVPIQLVPRSPRRSRKGCRAVRQLILSSRALFLHATPCRQARNSGNLALAAPSQDGPLPPSESKIRLFQTTTVDFTYNIGHMATVPGDKLIVQQGQGCSSRESYSGRGQRALKGTQPNVNLERNKGGAPKQVFTICSRQHCEKRIGIWRVAIWTSDCHLQLDYCMTLTRR